jgi:hypothetical protein
VSRHLVERYWAAQDPYEPDALAALRHSTWSADWPQSAERIPSHAADVAIHTSYPGYPAHRLERVAGSDEVWRPMPSPILSAPVRISGASDMWIGEFRLEYPDESTWDAIVTLELRESLVGHETVYYCRVLGSPPWPATSHERAPTPIPPSTASMEHDPGAERRHLDAFRAYFDRADTDPAAASRLLFHDAAVLDRPQFGTRVVGIDGIARIHEEQRGLLPGHVRRISASGDVLLTETRLDRADPAWYLVGVHEFSDAAVIRTVEYLAESYESPEWRRPWVEHIVE